jgi:hypothetical protein
MRVPAQNIAEQMTFIESQVYYTLKAPVTTWKQKSQQKMFHNAKR